MSAPAQGHDKDPGDAQLAGLVVAQLADAAEVDLCHFAWCGLDAQGDLGRLAGAHMAHQPIHRRRAGGECFGIATFQKAPNGQRLAAVCQPLGNLRVVALDAGLIRVTRRPIHTQRLRPQRFQGGQVGQRATQQLLGLCPASIRFHSVRADVHRAGDRLPALAGA